ncbi:Por secretion system C-terminal sorting domain-containing protein [Chryseobacterium oleae]|uniref:Por secretion system C-terminal sorting domain-containing protein n=1 Tax=Chryseobacterium oleae TaxID=491207 RepID=A0A1I4YI61_CHROL|nr:T9SS type A sorting domain-containing protein [Chryseobacterium oleae]SFN37711.1 Por secretion system C-terminal sorting domain-containing protein [Chryseobacterium oleae]
MKKINFLLAITVGIMAYAQPTVTRSAIDRINIPTTFRSGDVTSTSITAGSAGANVTWDFSAYTAANIVTSTISECPGQTNCSRFSSANRVTKPALIDNYDFNIMTDTEATMIGTYFGPSLGDGTITYTDPLIMYKFPVTYLQQFNENYQFNTVSASIGNSSESGQESFLADGYGTVITPTGTYTNVLRVKRMRTATQTKPGQPPFSYTHESYQWVSQTSGMVFSFGINTFTLNGNTNVSKVVSYLVPGALSTSDVNKKNTDISIFPNPSSDTVTLQSDEDIKKITVTSLDGKSVLKTGNMKNIDVSKLPKGTYIIQGELKNGNTVSKKMIKK